MLARLTVIGIVLLSLACGSGRSDMSTSPSETAALSPAPASEGDPALPLTVQQAANLYDVPVPVPKAWIMEGEQDLLRVRPEHGGNQFFLLMFFNRPPTNASVGFC